MRQIVVNFLIFLNSLDFIKLAINNLNNYIDTWNSQKINYFNFFYNNKTIIIDDLIKHIKKNIYFCNVHIFIDWIKNIIIIKSKKLIKFNENVDE